MGVLALKLLLAPGFVVGTSVVARRHGSLVGGVVGGLPVVGGPILIVLAVVHGRHFGAQASSAALLGMISLVVFVVVYAYLSRRLSWVVSLLLGWVAFAASTALLAALTERPRALVALAAAFVTFLVAIALMPRPQREHVPFAHPAWDLPMRALAAALMVVVLTAASSTLGSELSGLIAPFPVITSVLAAFTHAQRGHAETALLLRGMLGGFFVYATLVFLFAVALGAPA